MKIFATEDVVIPLIIKIYGWQMKKCLPYLKDLCGYSRAYRNHENTSIELSLFLHHLLCWHQQ